MADRLKVGHRGGAWGIGGQDEWLDRSDGSLYDSQNGGTQLSGAVANGGRVKASSGWVDPKTGDIYANQSGDQKYYDFAHDHGGHSLAPLPSDAPPPPAAGAAGPAATLTNPVAAPTPVTGPTATDQHAAATGDTDALRGALTTLITNLQAQADTAKKVADDNRQRNQTGIAGLQSDLAKQTNPFTDQNNAGLVARYGQINQNFAGEQAQTDLQNAARGAGGQGQGQSADANMVAAKANAMTQAQGQNYSAGVGWDQYKQQAQAQLQQLGLAGDNQSFQEAQGVYGNAANSMASIVGASGALNQQDMSGFNRASALAGQTQAAYQGIGQLYGQNMPYINGVASTAAQQVPGLLGIGAAGTTAATGVAAGGVDAGLPSLAALAPLAVAAYKNPGGGAQTPAARVSAGY